MGNFEYSQVIKYNSSQIWSHPLSLAINLDSVTCIHEIHNKDWMCVNLKISSLKACNCHFRTYCITHFGGNLMPCHEDSPAALCRGPCDWEQGLLPKASGLKPTTVEEAIAEVGPAALVKFSNDSSPTHDLSPSQDHLEILVWRNGDNKYLLF